MYRGYIKLWRKITDCDLWKIKPFSKGQAWIDLIMSANFTEKKIHFHQRLEEAARGEFVTSILKLSDKWGWSRCKVKAYLDLLQKLDNISYNTIDKRYIKIIICNYNEYQSMEENKRQEIKQEIEQEIDKRSTRDRQEIDITNNVKNIKECKEEKISIEQKEKNLLKIDYEFYRSKWNEYCTPRVNEMTQERKEKIKTRLSKEKDFQEKFLECVQIIPTVPFLSGKKTGWKATFDWIIKNDSNYIKVLEGNYSQQEQERFIAHPQPALMEWAKRKMSDPDD